MNGYDNFFSRNLGAIIGIIIGLVLACTGLYRVVLIIIAVRHISAEMHKKIIFFI